jgi:transcription elongation factor GreA
MRMPIRKPGKYANQKNDPHISPEKYNNLKKTLKYLKEKERPLAIKDVKEQAAFGDFSENAAYGIAKGKLRGINNRILKIENHLKEAIIIEKNKNSNKVELGAEVKIEINKNIRFYKILGSAEVDLNKGIISHNSPIGSALIGKKKGDCFSIFLNEKKVNIKILDIN